MYRLTTQGFPKSPQARTLDTAPPLNKYVRMVQKTPVGAQFVAPLGAGRGVGRVATASPPFGRRMGISRPDSEALHEFADDRWLTMPGRESLVSGSDHEPESRRAVVARGRHTNHYSPITIHDPLSSTRHCCRVESPATHSKQRTGVPATRHWNEGVSDD
jgi:hypothetical protein